MSDDDFKPYSNRYGIAGTSYMIQVGMKHNKWTILLLKANIVLDYYIFKDTSVDKLPERDRIVNWILKTIPFDIYARHVIRTVILLLQEADKSKGKRKVIPNLEDCAKAKEKLIKIEDSESKRPLKLEGVIEGLPYNTLAKKFRDVLSDVIVDLERAITALKKII